MICDDTSYDIFESTCNALMAFDVKKKKKPQDFVS